MKLHKIIGLIAAALSPVVFGFVVLSTLAVYVKDQTSAGFYGTVMLRSYFECGTGRLPDPNDPTDRGDPYVITRPRHLYNLSRLQGLGVFGEPTYFQLGKVGLDSNHPSEPYCYTSDSGSVTAPYLDMNSDTNSNWNKNRINAIGSEAFPFYGIFDGQNVEIKGLNVYADPQDAGLFGYTAHGSAVRNLFLSDITIQSLGYDETHRELYGKTEEIIQGSSVPTDLLAKLEPSLELKQGNTTLTSFIPGTEGTPEAAKIDFSVSQWTDTSFSGSPEAPSASYYIGTSKSYKDNYRYKLLCSGDLIKLSGNKAVVDLAELLSVFKAKREDNKYPIRAASSASIIASTTDSDGLDHSRVLMTLDFNFVLENSESNTIEMRPVVAEDHGNNIGFIVGHCDGSVSDCYVHNGSFQMNKAEGYYPLEHRSNVGLIGLIGNTVHNAATDIDASNTELGKSIGALDFTHIYDAIITDNTFQNTRVISNDSASPAITYHPNESATDYINFLRKNGNQEYVTQGIDMVSFKQKRVIQSDDLGVFTIATDYNDTGNVLDAAAHTKNSTIKKDAVDVNGSYYVYYATGEYDKQKADDLDLTYGDFYKSFNSDNPSQFFVGHYLPTGTELTSSSMEKRELHQNYFFRFKLDSRSSGKFYFADVDKDTDGGSFISKYFVNKLVDESGVGSISDTDSRCGVMLRYKEDKRTKEVDSFHASFATPDYSGGGQFFCIQKEEFGYPVANMINFTITTEQANVTIVAAPDSANGAAAVGIYRYDESSYTNNHEKIKKKFNEPDYAFFMPNEEHLSYFDYKLCAVDENGVAIPDEQASISHPIMGRIGKYNNDGTVFTEANSSTLASMPKLHGYGNEYGRRSDKKRLFAHTFKLPEGRYCIGSASGGSGYSAAKIYYICAQGQEEGEFKFDPNVFASSDKVERIDFLKRDRFGENDEITFNTVNTYNSSGTDLENQRCYVLLSQATTSLFDGVPSDLSFAYDSDSGKFKITTTTEAAMKRIIVENFGKEYGDYRKIDGETAPISGLNNTTVQLITTVDQTGNIIPYYYVEPTP